MFTASEWRSFWFSNFFAWYYECHIIYLILHIYLLYCNISFVNCLPNTLHIKWFCHNICLECWALLLLVLPLMLCRNVFDVYLLTVIVLDSISIVMLTFSCIKQEVSSSVVVAIMLYACIWWRRMKNWRAGIYVSEICDGVMRVLMDEWILPKRLIHNNGAMEISREIRGQL